jgi:hypothetical protein
MPPIGNARRRVRRRATRLSHHHRIVLQRGIRQSDDADQALLAVHDWKPAHLVLAHAGDDVVDVLVLEAISDILGHDVGNRRIQPFAGGKAADHDVAVGNHADDPVVIADRHESDVACCHHLRHLADSLARAGEDDRPRLMTSRICMVTSSSVLNSILESVNRRARNALQGRPY